MKQKTDKRASLWGARHALLKDPVLMCRRELFGAGGEAGGETRSHSQSLQPWGRTAINAQILMTAAPSLGCRNSCFPPYTSSQVLQGLSKSKVIIMVAVYLHLHPTPGLYSSTALRGDPDPHLFTAHVLGSGMGVIKEPFPSEKFCRERQLKWPRLCFPGTCRCSTKYIPVKGSQGLPSHWSKWKMCSSPRHTPVSCEQVAGVVINKNNALQAGPH